MKRAAAPDPARAAASLAAILGEDGLLVGGLAVGAHGFVCATRDIDFVARIPLAAVRSRLRAGGITAVLRRGHPTEGDFPCVQGTVEGVPFDVIPPLVPLEWERAVELKMADGQRILVVDLDGLIRMKLRAQGPQDLMDVAALVMRHPGRLHQALEAAAEQGIAHELQPWLADARLRAQVVKAARGERGRRKRVSPKGR